MKYPNKITSKMIIRIFVFSISLLFFSCGSKGQENGTSQNGFQLPHIEGEYLVEIDTTKIPIHIKAGFKENLPDGPVMLYLENHEYPFEALYSYIAKKKKAIGSPSPHLRRTISILEIDERLPYKVFSDIKSELRYHGLELVFQVVENGKGLQTKWPEMASEERSLYAEVRKNKYGENLGKWEFPEMKHQPSEKTSASPPPPPPSPEMMWKISDIKSQLKKENLQFILVQENGTITFNEKAVERSDLIKMCMSKIDEFKYAVLIIFDIDDKATYKDYMITNSGIYESYERLWNREAKARFNKKMSQLNRKEKNSVKQKYPFIVTNVSPMDFDFRK